MNNKDFILELSNRTGLAAAEVQKKVYLVTDAMNNSFQEGDSVFVPSFGVFEVKKKNERVIVSPTSGQRMLVPPKLVLNFRPNMAWKEKVKK